jgi:hypothetical protein
MTRNLKKVVNLTQPHTPFITCCWDECWKDGVELHKIRSHDHARGLPCNHPAAKHVFFVFCSERHKMMFLNGHRDYGNLPAGYR